MLRFGSSSQSLGGESGRCFWLEDVGEGVLYCDEIVVEVDLDFSSRFSE